MNIAYFMTFPISLKNWKENGSITRELEYIIKISLNHQISLFNYGEVDENIKSKYPQINFFELCKYKDSPFIKFFKSINFIFKNKKIFKKIDLVRSNQLWGSWLCLLVKIFYKKPFVLRCGYELYLNIKNEINIFKILIIYLISILLYKSSDIIVVTTNEIKHFISKVFFLPTNKIFVIPNYINTFKFKNKNFKKKKNSFISVGRISKEKDYKYLINSLSRINKEYYVTIVGIGPEYENIIKLISEKKIENKVFIKKRVNNEDLPDLYNLHENFVITSNYEGNPKSLLEAMACELLVIGSNVRGINSLIEDGKNGILFDKKHSNSLTRIVEDLLSDNIKKKNIVIKARHKILKYNSETSIITKEKEIIDHLKLDL